VLANSTEYQHALEEDANPKGWCKMMSSRVLFREERWDIKSHVLLTDSAKKAKRFNLIFARPCKINVNVD